MEKTVQISNERPTSPAEDFDLLRQEGIRYIQHLAGKTWSDHNEHDPGVTILEQLCYALTDLGYRIGYDVPDLLAVKEGDPYRDLFPAAEILTGAPLTMTDLRKVVLDVTGVANAWIETVEIPLQYRHAERELVLNDSGGEPMMIRGLYKIWLRINDDATGSIVVRDVMKRLATSRTACEDVFQVEVAGKQAVQIKAVIEVSEVDDAALFLAQLYYAVHDYICPSIHFHSMPEMLEKGWTVEEIMEGPALVHGFIDDAELNGLKKQSTLYASDLIRVMHSVPGLQAIKSFQFVSNNQVKDWKLDIGPGMIADLVIDFRKDVTLEKNGFIVNIDAERAQILFSGLKGKRAKRPLVRALRDVVVPRRTTRDVAEYYSIQNHFPSVYALGAGELPDTASPERIAWRQQLRAYLFIFDQILANSLAQVDHLGDIFSSDGNRTYFSQVPDSVPEYRTLIHNERAYNELVAMDKEQDGRKDRVLNHLMARFGEDFIHFSLLPGAPEYSGRAYKSNFLKRYPEVSGGRSLGPDLLSAETGGLEKRIRLKLGDSNGAFFAIEHLLLRPTAEEWNAGAAFMKVKELLEGDDYPLSHEPFSFQITYAFQELEISDKAWLRHLLREETPAHIQIRLVTLSAEEFTALAALYQEWRLAYASKAPHQRVRGLRNQIIDFVELGVTYPLDDLPLTVHNSIVPYGYTGKCTIRFSEQGVVYQVYRLLKSGAEQETSVKASGNGGDLIIETEALVSDSEFVIYALKTLRGSETRTRLNKHLSFEIGIDKDLGASLQETGSIPYSGQAVVRLIKSQERVEYQLFDHKTGKPLSDSVTGDNGERRIITYPLQEDVTLVLKALRTFVIPEVEGEEKTEEPVASREQTEQVDIGTFAVFVKPNTGLATSAQKYIVPHHEKAIIRIAAAQPSVKYQVLYRAFDEKNIQYDPVYHSGMFYLQYTPEGEAVRELHVVMDEARDAFAATERYTVKKSGADLQIETAPLTSDHVIAVSGAKPRPDVSDDLIVGNRFLVLVEPRKDLVWETPERVQKNTPASVTIRNPQRGVVYQLVSGNGMTPVSDPVIFHKNKEIDTARLGVDFIIDPYPDEIVVLTTPMLDADGTFRIKATQLYTGVSVVLDEVIFLEVVEL
jgi:hypothetical protein